jgi:threonine/homoserine efflux transporter RhtA
MGSLEIIAIVVAIGAILLVVSWRLRPGRTARLTDWQRFALLVFGLVALAVVALVYTSIRSGIDRL